MTKSTTPSAANVAGSYGHTPVAASRIAELLRPAIIAAEKTGATPVVVDGTLGAGGHSHYLLKAFPTLAVLGLDRDATALETASRRLAGYGNRFAAVHCRFDELGEVIDRAESQPARIASNEGVAGALFDFGVSSMQLDQDERGFAYSRNAPLDMRMDQTMALTAADVVNTYSHGDLARVLSRYGEERFAGKIASAICREREREPFADSARLVKLLYDTIPAATRTTGGHPAKRTFQALRIEVNGELSSIEAVIPAITGRLRPAGRAVFMSYQSLEDKIVKAALAELVRDKTPPGLPVALPGAAPEFRLATRGAEKATAEEIDDNPRAAPVRIRAIERLTTAGGTP